MIIGVTGMYCSGKDSVAEYLEKKGFTHFSNSDNIREEVKKRNQEITRDRLIAVGNELRSLYGHGVLSERSLEKMKGVPGDFVVTSIRHPEEVEVLRKDPHFFLVEVRTPIADRFKRMRKRKRGEKDPETLTELKAAEKLESQKEGPGQQLTNVIKMADFVIMNDGTLKQLNSKTERLLKDLRKKDDASQSDMRPTPEQLQKLFEERPDKVRYYMSIAKEVAARSNCLTTKNGAIVVVGDQIVATGYNGAPRKVRDCMERGRCLRREMRIPSGQRYELCRTVHAEANCLINAARAGTSVLGGDIYLFSERVWRDERALINAHPCFICKKFIINAGLRHMYCMQADGKIRRYSVAEWVKAWQKGDMTDDMDIFDAGYKGMKDRKCC